MALRENITAKRMRWIILEVKLDDPNSFITKQDAYNIVMDITWRKQMITNKNAAGLLSWLKVNPDGSIDNPTWYGGIDKDLKEALNMAISALEYICDNDCEHCTWTECPIDPCEDADPYQTDMDDAWKERICDKCAMNDSGSKYCDNCKYKRTSICGNCEDFDEFEEMDFVQPHKKIPVTLDLTPCEDAVSQKILQKPFNCRNAHCGAMCSPADAEMWSNNPEKCPNYKRVEQPCEDAVSREDAINKIAEGNNNKALFGDVKTDWKVIDFLKSLPPVTVRQCSLYSVSEDGRGQCKLLDESPEDTPLAKEQQSCEDAVSRADVRQLVTKVDRENGGIPNKSFKALYDGADELPPVTVRQTGEWICLDYQRGKFKCSKCKTEGFIDTYMYEPAWQYCPKCGSRNMPYKEEGVE